MIQKVLLLLISAFVLGLAPYPESFVSAQTGPSMSSPYGPGSGPSISLNCMTVPLVAETMASRHMSFPGTNQEVIKRVIEMETKLIDPTKILLTQKEYDKVAKEMGKLVHDVQKRDCGRLFELQKQRIQWQKELEDDVRKILTSATFKVSKKTKIELDAEKRQRPKTKKEQHKLRDQLLQLQMANLITGGVSEAEAKKKLIHRYELATKRVKELSSEDLFGSLLNAHALSLDPHSLYFSPDDLEDFKIQMGLSLTGIGATLQSRDGFTVVKELTPGGPADLQGELKTEDKIVAVAQGKGGEPVDVIDMNLKDVVKKIRGDKGTWVTLTVLRPGKEAKRLQIEILRDKIDLKDQAAKLTFHTFKRGKKTLKIGLLDLPSFYAGVGDGARDSAKDVKELLKKANDEKADGIVVDLSRNGGGALQSAIEIVGEFLRIGAVVGVGDGMTKPEILYDRDASIGWNKPVLVLTSTISASASEIFAGALKDYDRALIVGDQRTFGKGTVQQMMPLPGDLGVIKVTTSKFFLPKGASTQRLGVVSDMNVPSPFSYLEIGEDQEDYALPAANVPSFASTTTDVGSDWLPVDRSKIKLLAKKSKKRMQNVDTFQEIKKQEKERKDTTITIAEIFEDSKKETESADKEAKTTDNKTPNMTPTAKGNVSEPNKNKPNMSVKPEPASQSVSSKDSSKKDRKKDELTPQATEAMNILADYIESTGFALVKQNQPNQVAKTSKRAAQKK